MITQEINLNMIPDSEPVVMRVNQYDEGEGRLVIHLYKDNVAYSPSIATVIIQGTKPDKKGFAYDATISGNTVTADLTRQMTACAGDVRTQIIVTESEGKTGTFVFILKVQASALQLGTDMSETEIPAYLDGGVISVNGKTGSVVLSYRDVGALSDSTVIPDTLSDLQQDSTHRTVTDSEKNTWNNKADISNIPTALSDLEEDSAHRVVTDTEKATWNGKLSTVPTASANTLGGVKVGNGLVIDNNGVLSATGGGGSGAVDSVNGKTGNVVLGLSDLDGDSTHRTVSDAEKSFWNGKLGSLPIASANSLGGIMVGSNLSIDSNGVLSAMGGGGASVLDDLSDVTITSNPVNKSFLRYNTGAGVWQDEVYEAKDEILSSLFNITNYRWYPFSFSDTTDDEKISLSFLGEKAVYLSFLRSYILISDSATKSTIIPMSQTIDLSEIYTTGPLAGLKLTIFITVEDGISYINIKKSTPINLYTYNVTAVFNLLYN